MSDWKLIEPEATVNIFEDPQFGQADPDTSWNFLGDGAPDFTRETDELWIGTGSAQADFGGGTYATIYQTLAVTSQSYTLSCRVRRDAGGTVSAAEVVAWFDTGAVAWDSITEQRDGWWLCMVTGTATAGNRQFGVRCLEDDMHVDAVQIEAKAYRTTYCDGTQPGCAWNGAAHQSTSVRSAQSRAGGAIRDLTDDLGFAIAAEVGAGATPRQVGVDEFAVLPGGVLSRARRTSHPFSLIGPLQAAAPDTIHDVRRALLKLVSHDAVVRDAAGPQPVRLRYQGADVETEVAAHYVAGLEGNWPLETVAKIHEQIAVQFVGPDPLALEIGNHAAVLDTNDTDTFQRICGRLRDTGQWSDLGVTALSVQVSALAWNPVDERLYVGGGFTNMNGVAGRDYIAAYDPVTNTWATVGALTAVNGTVRAIAIAANGDVYIGGDFTNCGGAAGDYLAYYDLSAGSFVPVAAGGTGSVWALAFGLDGVLYFGGNFINWNAIANADYIGSWDGAAYAALGSGMDAEVRDLAVGLDGTLYAVGDFTASGATTMYRVGAWDESAWAAMGNGFNDDARGLAIHPSTGDVYATGAFETNQAATVTYNYVAHYTGIEWAAMGSGLDDEGFKLAFSPDEVLYIVGQFSEAVDLGLGAYVVRWRDNVYLPVDLVGPGTLLCLAFCRQDPVLPQNYDIFLGGTASAASYFAGDVTATNDGSAPVYPVLTLGRAGGTSATLISIRNEITGRELLFNYALLDGETLTIETAPQLQRITSSLGIERPDAILAACDFGSFELILGDNQITAFVHVAGAPTVTGTVQWRTAYDGVD